ncbi:hypothetical protein [Nonomuraea fuscirosea]|uniref:hypothetical protein n=1 Tax=Nonomuraea fuscirosea TaxID=1291556 RepID=UPI0034219284
MESLRAWGLAAALAIETGVEPPENDAFVSGGMLRTVERHRINNETPILAEDPLLDHMLPCLFQAAGVADGLNWNSVWEGNHIIIGELVELTRTGRVQRQTSLDCCVSRLLTGRDATKAAPFVRLWQELKPESAEISGTDVVLCCRRRPRLWSSWRSRSSTGQSPRARSRRNGSPRRSRRWRTGRRRTWRPR